MKEKISQLESDLVGIERGAKQACSAINKITNEHALMLDEFFSSVGLSGLITPVVSIGCFSEYSPSVSYARLEGCYPKSEDARRQVAARITPRQDEMVNDVLDNYAIVLGEYERRLGLLRQRQKREYDLLEGARTIREFVKDYVDAA